MEGSKKNEISIPSLGRNLTLELERAVTIPSNDTKVIDDLLLKVSEKCVVLRKIAAEKLNTLCPPPPQIEEHIISSFKNHIAAAVDEQILKLATLEQNSYFTLYFFTTDGIKKLILDSGWWDGVCIWFFDVKSKPNQTDESRALFKL